MKTPILLLAALAALPVAARERTTTEITTLARAALAAAGPAAAASPSAAAHPAAASGAEAPTEASRPLRILERREQLSIVGYPDGGYAIVSHDDRIPAILGYSTGSYTPQPAAIAGYAPTSVLDAYLADLNGYIAYCLTTGTEFRALRRAAGKRGSVGPLVTTKWDQGFPYYNDCPRWQTAACVTGCVATAAAQVLNYHQLPKTMHGLKLYSYTNQGDGRTRIVYNYGDYTIDWANMRDSYIGNGITREERLAVSRLMATCGVNSSMKYTTTESGSFTYTEADGINWFMDGIRADYYSLNGHEQLVYDELDAERPLIYSGSNGQGGHAFVIDGYDEEGLLHCNLGWSGSGDSYYLMTNMAGYSNGQGIVAVYPSEEPNYQASPCADVPPGRATVSLIPATEIIPDTQWYVLYNVGRSCHPYTRGKGKTIMNTCYLPVNDAPEVAAPHIIRFVTSTNANKPGYFIQSGEGHYFGSLKQGGNSGTSSTKTCNYSFGPVRKDHPGYFYIHDEKNDLTMDSNDAGAEMVGYGNQHPTDTVSNASWQLFPVTFEVPEGIERIEATTIPEAEAVATPTPHPAIPTSQQGYDLTGRPASRARLIIKEGRKVLKK